MDCSKVAILNRIKRVLLIPGSKVVLDHNDNFMVENGGKVYGLYHNRFVSYPKSVWLYTLPGIYRDRLARLVYLDW